MGVRSLPVPIVGKGAIGRVDHAFALNTGGGAMTQISGIADAEQLAALTELLEEYSRKAGIADNKPARDRLACRILSLFNDGIVKPADIRRELDSRPRRWLIDQTAR